MPSSPAAKRSTPSRTSRERTASERERILAAMGRWKKMNEAGVLAGRGMPMKELVSRVALDVCASVRRVQEVLKSAPAAA